MAPFSQIKREKREKKKPKSVQICDKIHKEILKRVYDEMR